MQTVGVIHSVKVVADSFETMVHRCLTDVAVYNLLDDYLSKPPPQPRSSP